MADIGNPRSQVAPAARPRPGLVTFAGIMLLVIAAFQLLYAILEFAHATWLAINVAGTMGGPLWLWGIVDLLFAILLLYAGYDLLRGGAFGRTVGLVFASLSAIRWFFYIPAAPWTSVVAIAVDILIIYGLAAHGEYFRSTAAT